MDLEADKTRVLSTLQCHRNEQASIDEAALILQGENLILKSLKLEGQPLTLEQYSVTKETLSIKKVPSHFVSQQPERRPDRLEAVG